METGLEIRIHGDCSLPTLVYLPGVHGDWTLVTSFRAALAGKVRFVEFAYPRTVTWSLDDYAEAIRQTLIGHGITGGWLLGESFGSQIVWPLLANQDKNFGVAGVILAGGFARYPVNWGVRLAHAMSTHWPRWLIRAALSAYRCYAVFRHRHAPETRASVREFVQRRLEPSDRLAIRHRLGLIAENDPRLLAHQVHQPLFMVIGLIDPIVPALPAWLWLRRNCPGYRAAHLIWKADHNVLGTAPRKSAEQVLKWIAATSNPAGGLGRRSAHSPTNSSSSSFASNGAETGLLR